LNEIKGLPWNPGLYKFDWAAITSFFVQLLSGHRSRSGDEAVSIQLSFNTQFIRRRAAVPNFQKAMSP
jgi:hypothetical protein